MAFDHYDYLPLAPREDLQELMKEVHAITADAARTRWQKASHFLLQCLESMGQPQHIVANPFVIVPSELFNKKPNSEL